MKYGPFFLAALLAFASSAQAVYPDRPIRIVVGFPAGQAQDVIARLVARKLQEVTQQPVIVDNKPGAAGILGAQDVARSAPDGYTLLVSSSGPLAINPSLYTTLPYHPQRDFTAIAELSILPLFLAVNPSSPARNVKELLEQARRSPGKLNYGSSGNGVTSHLAMELLKHSAGVFITHIPYKGSPPAVTDLMAGRLDAMIDTGPVLLPLAQGGKVRILAVTTPRRVAGQPAIPTMIESGIKAYDAVAWVGLVAPKGTPREVVELIHKALAKTWLEPEVSNALASLGGEAVLSSPDEFTRRIDSEIKRWALAVKLSGARID